MPNAYFPFELTPEQRQAFVRLTEWVQSEQGSEVFILRGHAGTGKTVLMSGLIKWLREKGISFVLLASTGRAAKILTNKTGVKASTIHGLIYIFEGLDSDLDKIEEQLKDFNRSDKGNVKLIFKLFRVLSEKQIVYLIDESSMISDITQGGSFAKYGSGRLLADLFMHDPKGKFVFIGDPFQLPPIRQSFSPALKEQYLEDKFNKKAESVDLRQVVRQSSDSGILAASKAIRQMAASNQYPKWPKFPLLGYDDIKVHPSTDALIQNYVQQLKAKGGSHCVLVSHTNAECTAYNQAVRKALGRRSNSVEKDDLLLVTQNNPLTTLMNGDIVRVLEVGEKKEYRYSLSFIPIVVQPIGTEDTYRVLLIEEALKSKQLNLTNEEHKRLFVDFNIRMRKNGVKKDSEEYYDLMRTDAYLNALRTKFGYAITCHKAQGGEWPEVFLAISPKIYGIPKPGLFNWIYTAITRAESTLHIAANWFYSYRIK